MDSYLGFIVGLPLCLAVAEYGMSITGDQSLIGRVGMKMIAIPKKLSHFATRKISRN
jgi:hypothetical protein